MSIMHQLTPEGQQTVAELAQRYGVSIDAVMTLLHALVNGKGTMAQFAHRELGGRGQWMPGGMVMVGDMLNHALKTTVDGLCSELSRLVTPDLWQAQPARSQRQSQGVQPPPRGGLSQADSRREPTAVSLFVPAPAGREEAWWPADLGVPAASGAQHTMRYAYFPEKRRVAVAVNGKVTVYDTLDHHMNGVSQHQGAGSSLTFTSQHGVMALNTLPVVSSGCPDCPEAELLVPTSRASTPLPVSEAASAQTTDMFAALERLAELKQKGILSEEEFTAKKAELLRRI
jgi:Short C-terminal domain